MNSSPENYLKIWEFVKNCQKSQFRYLELCRAATIKPRQIELSIFFLLDHNKQTRVYRLVLGPLDVWLWRKRDSPMEEDDCAPPRLLGLKIAELCKVV